MKHKTFLFGCLIIYMMMATDCQTPVNNSELNSLVQGSSLIFKAKILLLHTATTNEDDVSNTGVVMVTDVVEAPISFQNITGKQITVRFSNIEKMNAGEERMFFTEPYWIGESLGVLEKGSMMKDNSLYENKDITSMIKQARDNQDNEQLKKLLDSSNMVVTGRVNKIIKPDIQNPIGTEHDPEWRQAEIQVDEFIKGKAESKTIQVLYASSKDVMFFQSPKFTEGDEGIFFSRQTDPFTAKTFRINNMVIEPNGFIKGKGKTELLKSMVK